MRRILLTTLTIILSLQAWDYEWWNEPGPEHGEQTYDPLPGGITSGDRKMLIIVSMFPEDTATYLPPLYDTLITDSIENVNDSLYRWSVTNFLYTASWHQLRMTGDVNPGMNGQYVDFM